MTWNRAYLVYGIVVVLLAGAGAYRGWSFTSTNEVKNVPKSVRDNPGSTGRSMPAIIITLEENRMPIVTFPNIFNALVFALVGIFIFIVAFYHPG